MTALPYRDNANEDHDNAEHDIGNGAWIPAGLRSSVLGQIWRCGHTAFTNEHDDFLVQLCLAQSKRCEAGDAVKINNALKSVVSLIVKSHNGDN